MKHLERHAVYTLAEIFEVVKETPILYVEHKRLFLPVAINHVDKDQLLSNADIAASKWLYRYSTDGVSTLYSAQACIEELVEVTQHNSHTEMTFKAFPLWSPL